MSSTLALQQGEPESDFYRVLHRVADRLEPRYREAFREAVRQASDSLDEGRLLSALKSKDARQVVGVLRAAGVEEALERGSLRQAIRETLLSAADASAEELADFGISVTEEGGANAIAFQSVNQKAVQAAREQAGLLITEVSDETRQAVREYVEDAFTDGVPPRRLSRQVRSVVGVHSQQAGYISNMRRDLEALQDATEERVDELVGKINSRRLDAATQQKVRSRAIRGEITDEFIDEVVDTYSTSMLNHRAQNIARTETIKASNRGQQALWEAGADDGVIDRNRARRRWTVTPDDRLCPICAPMAGATSRMDEPFTSPTNGATAMVPPIHPSCRCAVALDPTGGVA